MSSSEYGVGRSIGVGIGLTVCGVLATVIGAFAFALVFTVLGIPLSTPASGGLFLGFVEAMYLLVGWLYVSQTRLSVPFGDLDVKNLRLVLVGTLGALGFAIVSFRMIAILGLTLESAFRFGDATPSIGQLPWTAVAFVAVAVSEEYLFRGALQRRLSLGLGERGGLLVASLLFGSVHFFNYRGDLLAVVLAALVLAGVGTILGYVYQRSRALVVPIAVHFCYNLALVGLAILGFRLV